MRVMLMVILLPLMLMPSILIDQSVTLISFAFIVACVLARPFIRASFSLYLSLLLPLSLCLSLSFSLSLVSLSLLVRQVIIAVLSRPHGMHVACVVVSPCICILNASLSTITIHLTSEQPTRSKCTEMDANPRVRHVYRCRPPPHDKKQ